MGQIIHNHPDWQQGIYWQFNPKDGWTSYHQGLDEITEYSKETDKPFILVFHPSGDIPRGNPMHHMNRIVKISKTDEKLLQTIIIMESSWFLAKAFASVLNKIMSLEPEVKLVFSLEEAKATYANTLATQES